MVFEPIATERSLTRESWSQRSVGLELGMRAGKLLHTDRNAFLELNF